MLTDEELTRYARQIVLPHLGGPGQQRLKAAKVAVIGAGGIGAAVIPALAGAGVGRLTIKKRGVDVDPAALRTALKLRGDGSATLFVTRIGSKRTAILADRLS